MQKQGQMSHSVAMQCPSDPKVAPDMGHNVVWVLLNFYFFLIIIIFLL